MSEYHFNGEIAAKYGVSEAVFIHNLYWWIRKNDANGRHFHDGKTWTYNSMDAFVNLLPFLSKKQIRRIICNLREDGAILCGNYNKDPRDRTMWYALSDEVLEVYGDNETGSLQMPERADIYAQTGAPLPDSKPYSKQIYVATASDETLATPVGGKGEKGEKEYPPDCQEMQLSQLLFAQMQKNNPHVKRPNMRTWCREMNRMLRLDHREFEDAADMIRFSQWHPFWRKNILSAGKLREKYDQLYLAREEERRRA